MGAPSSEFREVERREEPDRLEAAKRIDDNYRESSFERERQFRAAVASGAAYLTLMATASIQGLQTVTDVAGREATVRTAQFFLTILAALILRYTIASIRGLTEDIVDNAARHHELEALDSRIEPSDMRLAADNAAYRRTGRVFRYIRPRLSAAIPRSGKSQRHAVVLGALLAALPAAWFSLAPARTTTLDLAVVGVTAFAGAAWLRLLFVGAKHWVWVDPRCGKLVRRPSKQRPPRWWWRYRLSSDT